MFQLHILSFIIYPNDNMGAYHSTGLKGRGGVVVFMLVVWAHARDK